ncbi:formylglycine-generating enzyme family protein [bacterium]|nr:formylglycine-generating enzyme family protein [bacterium]
MKKGLIFMALCLCLAAVTSFSATVWTSDVAFDGTPTSDTVVLKPTDNIGYSTALVGGEWKCVTIKVNDVTDPTVQIPNSGTIFQTPNENVEFEGSFTWNYISLNLPKTDTYKIEETAESTSDYNITSRYFTIVPEPTVLLFAGILGVFFLRRRAKALLAVLAAVALCSFSANATTTVSSVNCLQLFPVHREVVINYTITTDYEGDLNIKFYGSTDKGATTFDLADKGTLTKDGASGKITTGSGTYKTIWTPDSTLNNVTGTIRIGVEAEEYVPPKTYMVLDVDHNTVTYLDDPPSGGFNNNTYKGTKMAFRYVEPGTFTMGSPNNELGHKSDETQHSVTLTKGFYIGIFEVTEYQYDQVNYSPLSMYKPKINVGYSDIRGSSAGAGWPASSAVDSGSYLGKLRAATGLNFDLPTEAQWEYACRANTTTALNSGKNLSSQWDDCPEMDEVGCYDGNYMSLVEGGRFNANAWGIYDMHGNAIEHCLDWYSADLGSAAVTDPKGPSAGSVRVVRGGGAQRDAWYCRSACRQGNAQTNQEYGFRIVLVVE